MTIASLNDAFRRTFTGGNVLITAGVWQMPNEDVRQIVALVQQYDDFTEENDPHGEHCFGSVTFGEAKVFWKIDYYDEELVNGSEDPADPEKTTRVLTILLSSEY